MKKFVLKGTLLFILVSVVYLPSLPAQTAILTDFKGKVEVLKPGTAWAAAVKGMRIDKGMTISTGFNSSATLELGSSVVLARALTRLTLEELVRKENTVQTSLFLKVGKVRAEIKSSEGLANDFKLRSPISTAAVRGTTLEADGETTTSKGGPVSVSNIIGQTRTINDGEQTTVSSPAAPPIPPEAQRAADASVATGPIVVTGGPAPTIAPAPTILNATFYTGGSVVGYVDFGGSVEANLTFVFPP